MSSAPREPKWRIAARSCAGQVSGFGQRVTDSPGARTSSVPHSGHVAGYTTFGRSA